MAETPNLRIHQARFDGALLETVGSDRDRAERLLSQLYPQLRRLAHAKLRSERPDHTLDTSALAYEAYLKLSGETRVEWRSRSHFLAMAAVAMRRILIDYAKGRNAAKRGGGNAVHVTLDGAAIPEDRGTLEPVVVCVFRSGFSYPASEDTETDGFFSIFSVAPTGTSTGPVLLDWDDQNAQCPEPIDLVLLGDGSRGAVTCSSGGTGSTGVLVIRNLNLQLPPTQ